MHLNHAGDDSFQPQTVIRVDVAMWLNSFIRCPTNM